MKKITKLGLNAALRYPAPALNRRISSSFHDRIYEEEWKVSSVDHEIDWMSKPDTYRQEPLCSQKRGSRSVKFLDRDGEDFTVDYEEED